LPDTHPALQPILFTFAQVREDLAKHIGALTAPEIWTRRGGASVGFHLKHLAGSVDRLTTYLEGRQLSDNQLRTLREEGSGNENAEELLRMVGEALASSERRLRYIDADRLFEARHVGRRQLPTTVIGLLVHLSEHTQRHVGQAITIAKLLREAS
jgi:uncharacterized damage-inducible protein DinB